MAIKQPVQFPRDTVEHRHLFLTYKLTSFLEILNSSLNETSSNHQGFFQEPLFINAPSSSGQNVFNLVNQ